MGISNLFLIIFGLIFVRFGIIEFRRIRKIERNKIKTQGIVVGSKKELDNDNDIIYYPIIEFRTREGKHLKQKFFEAGRYYEPQIGQKINLVYELENPSNISHSNFLKRNFKWILSLSFGSLVTSLGILLALFKIE